MKALIVDDSSFMREYICQILRRLGVACMEACDGSQALEVLQREGAFDLILVDANMPVMGGLECVKRLRQEGLGPLMRVMMVTTVADSSFVSLSLEYGADEFLMKPFTSQGVKEKLLLLGFDLAA